MTRLDDPDLLGNAPGWGPIRPCPRKRSDHGDSVGHFGGVFHRGRVLLTLCFPFEKWVDIHALHHGAHDVHGVVLGVSFVALGAGLSLAVAMYVFKTPDPVWVAGRFPALYQLVTVRYFDRALFVFVRRPLF
jgi:hypothetical protein